jgi:exopolysaccharide biosynthesis WecB/TagA/CpsF family protein
MRKKLLHANNWSQAIAPVVVGGVPIAPLSTAQWVELMLSDCRAVRGGAGRTQYHTAANGNMLSVYARDRAFREAVDRADAVAADGVSVMWGARLFGRRRIPDRAATTDLFHDLARAAESEGLSMYFLGATPEENAAAVAAVRSRYPRLTIAGSHHGYFSRDEEESIVADIAASRSDVLWVALGVPREDLFVVRNFDRLQGIGWIKTCGGLFNFLSGQRSRAPLWMQRSGLEWVYRMALEPRRLAGRYVVTNIHSIWRMAVASESGAGSSPPRG